MTGGLKETASRLALAAMFCVMGTAVFGAKPVHAADLGGDCCADLEERVAELEATTVRKGNKKVSIQVYGKVNRFVAAWDDGAEQNVYVDNNSYSSTRFGFRGNAKITGDWSGGYRMEVEDRTALSKDTNQFSPGDDPGFGQLATRHSYMYVANKEIGELRWGLTSSPKDDITKDTHVGGTIIDTMHSDFYLNRSFFLRPKGFNTETGLSVFDWSDIQRCYSSSSAVFDCSTRRNMVVFQSKKFFETDVKDTGLWFNWGWGEDDIWALAARYKGEWDNWKIGGGVAFEDFTDERVNAGGGGLANFKRDIQEWGASASIKHKPTGLFVFGAWSSSEDDDSNTINAGVFTGTSMPTMEAWDVQIGIQKQWWDLGNTTFWGGYTQADNGIGGFGPTRAIAPGDLPSVLVPTEITGSETNKWYLAFDQEVVATAMDLYIVYQHIEGDLDLVDSTLNPVNAPIDGFDVIYSGARIYF